MTARIVVTLLLCAGLAEAEGLLHRDHLFGSWGGRRSTLEDAGLSFEAVYTGEIVSVVSGGARQESTYLGNVDLAVGLDLETMWGLPGMTAAIYVLGDHGGDPTGDYAGDLQGLSNIEADDTWKLYEFWIEKRWELVSLRAGLYDLNSEFDANETGSLFLNASHGIGPDLAQSGANGPSIFPTTSLALRLRAERGASGYVQVALLDGVPGDVDDPKGTHISWSADEGFLLAAEVGRVASSEEPWHKMAVGAWSYTGAFDDIVDVDAGGEPISRRGALGCYVLVEREVLRTGRRSLALFGRAGVADTRVHQLGAYTGAGLVASGVLPGQWGLAWAGAHNSGRFQDANPWASPAEHSFEVTWRLQLAPWLAVAPDLQYVLSPGAVDGTDNLLAWLVRFESAF